MNEEKIESGSEDEGNDKLSEAIKRLDKTQHIRAASRDGSEFGQSKTSLPALLKLLSKSSEHASLGRSLKQKKKTLPKPLERRDAEKIKRLTGFIEIKTKLDRWNAIVTRNRSAEQLKFPLLELEDRKKGPKDEYLEKYQLKSALETELEKLEPEEEEVVEKKFPLTMAEMIEHRKELAKLRAKQSYREAKARRQNKIKSKKFHRIQRKEKMKQQLKEFEALQKTNPEEALRKLEQLEKNRAEERVTLRHKSTGKWAQNKLVRAKYDKATRQELSEQLKISKELTQKINLEESESEPEEDSQTIINDDNNPWLKQSDEKDEYADFVSGYKKYWEEKNKLEKAKESEDEPDDQVVPEQIAKVDHEKNGKKRKVDAVVKNKKKKRRPIVSTSAWKVESLVEDKKIDIDEAFDELQEKCKEKFNKKLQKIQETNKPVNKKAKKQKEVYDEFEKLSFKNKANKPVIDEELDETSSKTLTKSNKHDMNVLNKNINIVKDVKNVDSIETIDPNKFVAAKTRNLPSTLPDMELGDDFLDDKEESNKMTIAEAFEDDDIVASFQQEKEDDIKKSKPKVDDSYLPGWGNWTGKTMSAPKRKKRRIFFSGAKLPRKDAKKDNLILREVTSDKLKPHLVSELPFPFKSVKDFETTIRAPIGNTFVTETAHLKLTKPAVVVKSGIVIKPMDESQLISQKQFNKKK